MNYLKLFLTFYFSVFTLVCHGEIASDTSQQSPLEENSLEDYWENNIKNIYFSGKDIIVDSNQDIIKLEAPYRAEDPAIVPISIQTMVATNESFDIIKIHVFIDKNPSPLVGVFKFSELKSKADLSMRVRVNEFTYIRAIAETSDGKFYMTKKFVKASGGCSAPPPPSAANAKLLGKMRTRIMGRLALSKPNLVQFKIKHPNYSGLEMVAPGSEKTKQNFIKNIKVSLNDKTVLDADLTFSISTDPSFRFYITPEKEGTLEIEATDTANNIFTHSHVVDHNNVSIAIPLN